MVFDYHFYDVVFTNRYRILRDVMVAQTQQKKKRLFYNILEVSENLSNMLIPTQDPLPPHKLGRNY